MLLKGSHHSQPVTSRLVQTLVKKILNKEILWARFPSFREDFGKFLQYGKKLGELSTNKEEYLGNSKN